MNQQTQNLPAEYVPVMQMTQKESSIRQGITTLKEKILVTAGEEFQSWPVEKQDQFFERTIIAIAKDEKLNPCFESPEGKLSLIEAVEKTVSTALEIGGKHAYLVPQKKSVIKNGKKEWITEARFSIRDRGYYALLCGGKRPIFQDLRWGAVRAKQVELGLVEINEGTGEVKAMEYLGDDAGEIKGCWVQAIKLNGQKEAKYFHVSKINEWRNSSPAYKYAIKNNQKDTPWIEWYEEMALQSSIRHFCSRYEEARELLSSALYDDDKTEQEERSPVDIIDETLEKPESKEEPGNSKPIPDETEPEEKELF